MKDLRLQERAFIGLALMALDAGDADAAQRRIKEALTLASIRGTILRAMARDARRLAALNAPSHGMDLGHF